MLKALILDLDGTLYKGNKIIPGVPKALQILRKNGIQLFFVSNASMRTRKEQMEKLRKIGIFCTIHEMYNSAYATASFIKKNYPRAQTYVISEGGLQTEFRELGIKLINNEKANLVVTGLDTKITFEKLTTALRALLNGATFIASNADRVYPTDTGILPGSGTIAAFLEYGTKKKPIVIGKPSTHLLEAVLRDNKLKPHEVLVVGDNYETDVLVAKKLKIKSVLVLSGLTKKKDLKKLKKPDFVINSVTDLPKLLGI